MDAESPKTTPASKANEAPWEQRFVERKHGSGKKKQSLESLFWQDINETASTVLTKANKSGTVSKAEIGKVITSGALHGEEAQVGAALYNNFEHIKTNGLKFGTPKINAADFSSFAHTSKDAEGRFNKVDDLAYWASDCGNLKKLSGDSAVGISLGDIKKAQAQGKLNADDRAMLVELSANFNSVSKNGKIGDAEIESYYKTAKKNPDFLASKTFQRDMRRVEQNQQNPQAHKLFANEKDPLKSITADSVKQAFAGDCAFKAALSALAAVRPQEILNMIKTNGSNFEVSLPGVKEKSISVSKPTDEELSLFSGVSNSNGFWPSLLAKAYGEHVYQSANAIEKARMSSEISSEWAGEDSRGIHAIEALTGRKTERLKIEEEDELSLKHALLKAQKDKRIVLLGTANGNDTPDGFSGGHAYSISNVSDSSGGFKITVRDPRASGKDSDSNPTKTISLQSLKKNFRSLYVESRNN